MANEGQQMYDLCGELFPICRSLTGRGNRETLRILQREVPEMVLHEIPTGTEVYDWTIPKEWEINDAWVEYEDGTRVIDFADTNLHLMGYSTPIDAWMELDELQQHLYSMPEHPDWIPYIVSYYKERWGFCLTDNARKALKPGKYHVHIDSRLFDGSLTYGEIYLPGEMEDEIYFGTYICHPSMANNELSGPAVAQALAKYVKSLEGGHHYSYRFVFNPETIGSIAYMATVDHLAHMQKSIKAGFNLSCVGDDKMWGYLPSPQGNNLADRVAQNVLNYKHPGYRHYTFLDRGSDEREYCSPGAHLPFAVITRSKYGDYPEYHTSADDMNLISSEGLQGTYDCFVEIINALEHNHKYRVTTVGEPQLGKRDLYPTLSDMHNKEAYGEHLRAMMNLIAYADGTRDLIDISNAIGAPVSMLIPIVKKMEEQGLFERVK